MNAESTHLAGSLEHMVRAYPVNTALIRMREGELVYEWAVHCDLMDNAETMRKHAERFLSHAEFVAVAFNRLNS